MFKMSGIQSALQGPLKKNTSHPIIAANDSVSSIVRQFMHTIVLSIYCQGMAPGPCTTYVSEHLMQHGGTAHQTQLCLR